jgi:hypothetical protein
MVFVMFMNENDKIDQAPRPVKVPTGDLTATKTYVHNFVESPDGSRLLYREFADPEGPFKNVTAMRMCRSDLTDHVTLFDIPYGERESIHGSESMVWLNDDRFYYNGMLYSTAERRIVWRIDNTVEPSREISAWTFPARGLLFVNIRTGSNSGFYTLDPYTDTVPEPKLWIGRDTLKPYIGGNPDLYNFTYIFLSPGGKRVFFDLYHNGCEHGFTANADGSGIVKLGTTMNRTVPWNGHTIWFDDDWLIHPSGRETDEYLDGFTRMCDWQGKRSRIISGRSNHITISPDRKWVAVDDCYGDMKLYPFGSVDAVAQLTVPEMQGGPGDIRHAHPSFSRDSRRVYYMAKHAGTTSVFYSDVSKWTYGGAMK